MGNAISQMFPPAAKFTEENLPDQTGKIFIVTGSSSGIGKELTQILFSRNAKVYVATRSSEKAVKAIESIKQTCPNSKGRLEFLHLDLGDMTTIKKTAEEFLRKETKLDVLWNNAGVQISPQGSQTKQGYELQLGINTIGPFLFTKLLTPILQATAKEAPLGSVRVVWTSSSIAESLSPQNGVDMDNLDYKVDKGAWHKYGVSKAGSILHSREYAKRYRDDGIVSVPVNPGNLKTNPTNVIVDLFLHPPIHGAYTNLFAGLSPEVTMQKSGAWIVPWGRFLPLRKDFEAASKTEAEGGTGVGLQFWDWTEEQVKPYL